MHLSSRSLVAALLAATAQQVAGQATGLRPLPGSFQAASGGASLRPLPGASAVAAAPPAGADAAVVTPPAAVAPSVALAAPPAVVAAPSVAAGAPPAAFQPIPAQGSEQVSVQTPAAGSLRPLPGLQTGAAAGGLRPLPGVATAAVRLSSYLYAGKISLLILA